MESDGQKKHSLENKKEKILDFSEEIAGHQEKEPSAKKPKPKMGESRKKTQNIPKGQKLLTDMF